MPPDSMSFEEFLYNVRVEEALNFDLTLTLGWQRTGWLPQWAIRNLKKSYVPADGILRDPFGRIMGRCNPGWLQ